jgi:hypothetical protein
MHLSLWKHARKGKVPVSGADTEARYGTGFDSMWTDMSEIVRPTRDGINGREYISTVVDLGRKLNHLEINSSEQLISKVPDNVSLPIPILFDIPVIDLTCDMKMALVQAAAEIGTGIILPAGEIDAEIEKYSGNVIPFLKLADMEKYEAVIKNARMISIEYDEAMLDDFSRIKEQSIK